MVSCAICGERVDADALGTYHRVQGWEVRRKQGGTNALKLRESLFEFAHRTCIEAAARGHKGQGRLDL
jgi:hypothetical protein